MSEKTPGRTRQETVVAWTVAHAGELAGVGVPLAAGLLLTPWLHLLSLAATALWVANELRLRRSTSTTRAVVTTGASTTPARQLASTAGTGSTESTKEARA